MNDSELEMNQSFYEKKTSPNHSRLLYVLVLLCLVAALLWASFGIAYPNPFGNGIRNHWWYALIAGIIAVALIFVATFVKKVQKSPISIAIYAIFLLTFSYALGYLAIADQSRLFYYALWMLAAMILFYVIYASFADKYLGTIECIMGCVAATVLVLFIFIFFTKIEVWKLILVAVPVFILGFYLNNTIRTMVRTSYFDESEEDSFNGAVRIWLEGCFVFCKMGELTGKQFTHRYS